MSDGLPPAPYDWEGSRLPVNYKKAVAALQVCERIDECLEWINQAVAFGSYYRQAKDDTLMFLCQRIKIRAVRRCGELYLESGDKILAKHARENRIDVNTLRNGVKLAEMDDASFEKRLAMEPVPSIPNFVEVSFVAKKTKWSREKRQAYRFVRELRAASVPGLALNIQQLLKGLDEVFEGDYNGYTMFIITAESLQKRLKEIISRRNTGENQ